MGDETTTETKPNGNVLDWRIRSLEQRIKGPEGHEPRIVSLETELKSVKESGERIEKKLDSTNSWLRGIAGSLILAMILLLVNLIFGTRLQVGH